ncbi:uncharacterized protein LOC114828295 [Galendromus occidentalis]|uniref:Uncharacterized protein LOC114828295 n=1 Tax=Galendromus occidentalis TaxID=34638 RepID=A0AAJ7WHV8_9ACAR|nr:uncharacterized protein LOC114828295 [Galendromus occidentalis]
MVKVGGKKIQLFSSPGRGSVFENRNQVLNVGSQMLFSLLLCGLAEVWLSEHTEEHIMQYPWLHEEEYLKRQLHVALAFISVLCMMSASRISAACHVHFCLKEDSQQGDMRALSYAASRTRSQRFRAILAELALTMLQGTLSSVLSPLIVLLVYVITIGANTLLGFHYKLHEHLTVEAVSDLIYVSLQAATATALTLYVPLYSLTYALRAIRLDPDIVVVPLASVAGHFVYMELFVMIHRAPSSASAFLLTIDIILSLCYFATKSSHGMFPIGDLVPAIAMTAVLSMQFATVSSGVYEKYPKIELIFSLTGFLAIIHASHVSTSLQVETARCTPYKFPDATLFGSENELLRVALSLLVTPFIAPLLSLHSGLTKSGFSSSDVLLHIGFCLIWLPIVLLIARWSNHFIRHYYGKAVRAGCPTISLLELTQRLMQSTIYVYIVWARGSFSEEIAKP